MGRLRAIETDLVHETQHLRSTIRMLGDLLADSGVYVNLSPVLACKETAREPDASLQSHNSPSNSHHAGKRGQSDVFRARHTGAAAATDASETGSTLYSKGPAPIGAPLTGPESPQNTYPTRLGDNSLISLDNVPTATDHHLPAVTSRHRGVRLGDLDPTTVGMEFVLA